MQLTDFTWQQLIVLVLSIGILASIFVWAVSKAAESVIKAISTYDNWQAKRRFFEAFRK